LHDKREENPQNTLRALWHNAYGSRVSPIAAEKLELPMLTLLQIVLLEESIENRLLGIPLAHLTERQHFMGLDYIVNKGLYIPRKETELLAKSAIVTIENDFASDPNAIVLDMCSGIGTVALALAHYCSNTTVYGSDIYEPAIDAAEIIARHLSLEKRATFFKADMFDPFESLSLKNKTNLIVSNG
jgi:release factor glutamine methyltransferase